MYPGAEVPVLPLGFVPDWTPQRLHAFGQALAPLADEGVLIIGSGSITHNLRLLFGSERPPVDAPEIAQSAAFRAWVAERAAAADWGALNDYRRQAPFAALMHPTDAYANLVERLLDSPRYGERWARHWLDLVGYAEQIGTEGKIFAEHAWRYRDYLIDAFKSRDHSERVARSIVTH